MERDIYSGQCAAPWRGSRRPLIAANNYASALVGLSASKKPRHCCAKRRLWRDASSEMIIGSHAQTECGLTQEALYKRRRRHAR